jgi:acetyl-CoA synthetase
MSEELLFQPSAAAIAHTQTTGEQYAAQYERSIKDPDGFWAEQAKRLDWVKFPTKIKNTSFAYPDVSIKWFEDGILNVAANCIDRHLAERGDDIAIIWEPDNPADEPEYISYRQEGRPRHHLPADDSAGCLCHARLRPYRRGALGGFRRLLAGRASRPYQ